MIANYNVLLAGRFIGGMGVGASSMLTPQFLAENSPKSIRGSMTACYNFMIVMSLMIAFFINYGVSLWKGPNIAHDNSQWRTTMGMQLIPGALMCLMIPFVPETPRYLINQGKDEQGLRNLCKLRELPADHYYVQTEYQEIKAQVNHEQEIHKGHSYWVVIQDIFTDRSNLQRFVLAISLFLFHKFTGTDSLNYYAPAIFELIGVKGGSSSLLTTGVYGTVKFVTTIFYVGYLVDRIGRRLPLLVGVKGGSSSLLTTGVYGTVKFVTTIFYVGYLVDRIGRRLPLLVGVSQHQTPSLRVMNEADWSQATMQGTAMLYLALYLRFAGSNVASDTVGGTPAGGIVGIIFIYIYAFGWSFGHSVACYVVAAEIFPTRIVSFKPPPSTVKLTML